MTAPPASVPARAHRGVEDVLARARATCLVRAVIRQAWHHAHGTDRDLVIGVTPPAEGFRAHAWLEGDRESSSEGYTELTRRSASSMLA